MCALCRLGVSGFDAAYSFGFYEGPLRRLVHLLKYERIPTLASPLGKLALRALPRDQRFDGIVAMPMHWRRRWTRGFNQAELLAREVARKTGLPVQDLLRRRKHTQLQAGLTNAARRKNVVGAFEVRNRAQVEGLRILLIDDVLTTGATAAAAAATLKRAGASRVVALTLARADRRSWSADLHALEKNLAAKGAGK